MPPDPSVSAWDMVSLKFHPKIFLSLLLLIFLHPLYEVAHFLVQREASLVQCALVEGSISVAQSHSVLMKDRIKTPMQAINYAQNGIYC